MGLSSLRGIRGARCLLSLDRIPFWCNDRITRHYFAVLKYVSRLTASCFVKFKIFRVFRVFILAMGDFRKHGKNAEIFLYQVLSVAFCIYGQAIRQALSGNKFCTRIHFVAQKRTLDHKTKFYGPKWPTWNSRGHFVYYLLIASHSDAMTELQHVILSHWSTHLFVEALVS